MKKLEWRDTAYARISRSLRPFQTKKGKVAKYSIGFSLAIAAAVLGGLSDVLPKPILEGDGIVFAGLNPIAMVAIMYLINGLVFTGISKKRNPVKDVGRRNFLILVIIGLAEITATATFYFGLKETSAANAAILGNSDIIFTTVIAMIFLREILKRKELGPFSLIIFGSIMIPIGLDLSRNNFQLSQFVLGDFLVILAGLFYGIEMTLYRYVCERVDSRRILQIISFVGGAAALGVVFALQLPIDLRLEDMPTILVSGVFGIGLSVLFIVMAIKHIGAIRTILIFSTTTLFGILFSFAILGEEIVIPHLVAFALVFVGIYLLRRKIAEK